MVIDSQHCKRQLINLKKMKNMQVCAILHVFETPYAGVIDIFSR